MHPLGVGRDLLDCESSEGVGHQRHIVWQVAAARPNGGKKLGDRVESFRCGPDGEYFIKRPVPELGSALKSVEGVAAAGELLHYGYGEDPAGGIVSFASLGFR